MDSADKANGGGKPAAAGGAPAPPAPLPPMALPPPPKSARVPAGDEGSKDIAPAAAGTADLGSAIVDDGDLIEKEWVNRAKQIVSSTRNDPYKQSEQLSALRAEYMKKRYGKDIKLDK